MSFDQTAFYDFILEQGIVGFFDQPIKLSSGRYTSWYVNWRNVSADVFQLERLTDFVLDFLADKNVGFDCLYGTPDGATKLAVVCQYKWAKLQSDFGPGKYPLVMGRKTPKDHGEPKDRYFVGAPAGRVVVLEDVTTTGGSLLKTVLTLQELGYDLAGAVTLTNRNEVMDDGRHVSEVLAEKGVPYFNLSQGLELLPLAVKKFKPSQPIKQSIIDEFKQYGESEIML